jgi:hypothetical protein
MSAQVRPFLDGEEGDDEGPDIIEKEGRPRVDHLSDGAPTRMICDHGRPVDGNKMAACPGTRG